MGTLVCTKYASIYIKKKKTKYARETPKECNSILDFTLCSQIALGQQTSKFTIVHTKER